MTKTREFAETLIDYIDESRETNLAIMGGRLVLGGSSGPDGGSGGTWNEPIGQLVQTKVTYDTTEAETLDTALEPSLLDNLNHIRYHVHNTKPEDVTPASSTEPGITFTYPMLIGEGTGEVTPLININIIDVWGIITQSGSSTIGLFQGETPIVSGMNWGGAAGSVVRTTTLTSRYVPSGTLLTATASGTTIPDGTLYVLTTKA